MRWEEIGDKASLESEVNAWQKDRDAKVVKVDWRFTTADKSGYNEYRKEKV